MARDRYSRGFIVLPRDHFSRDLDPFWRSEPLSRWEAFLDLVGSAAFKPTTRSVHGSMIELERGEVLASLRFLEKRWHWSRKKVQLYLEKLQKLDRITVQKKAKGGTVYLIAEYDTYSPKGNGKGNGGRDTNDTPESQERAKRNELQSTSKNGNEVVGQGRGDVVLWLPISPSKPSTAELEADPYGAPFEFVDGSWCYGIRPRLLEDLEIKFGDPFNRSPRPGLDVEAEIADCVVDWSYRQPEEKRSKFRNVISFLERWLSEEKAKLEA